jgi:hypothetical protein
MDPNLTHPDRQKDVLEKLGSSHGGEINSYSFQAIAWYHDLKNKDTMCWQDKTVGLVKWSPEVVTFVKGLSTADPAAAKKAYAKVMAKRRTAL